MLDHAVYGLIWCVCPVLDVLEVLDQAACCGLVKVKVKVALLSITLHVKTYKGIEKNVSHSPTVKHISAHAQQQIRQDI